jgi:hypothetical protein
MTLYHQILTDNDEVDIVVDYNPSTHEVDRILEVCFNKVDYLDTINFLTSLNFIYQIDWHEIYKENKQQFESDMREDA